MTTMGDQQRNNSSDEGGKKDEKKKAKPTTNQKRKELKKEIAEKQETNKREQKECNEKEEENQKLRAKIEESLRLIGDEQKKGCVIDESCMAQWKEACGQYAKICQNSPSSSQGNRAVKLTACSSDVVPHSNGDTSAPIGLFHGQKVTRSNVKRTSCAATSRTVTSADQTTTQASGLQNGDGIPTSPHSMPTATTSTDTVLTTRQTCPHGVNQLGTDPLQTSVPHLSQCNGVNGSDSIYDIQPQQTQCYAPPASFVQDGPLNHPDIINGHNNGFVNGMVSPSHYNSASSSYVFQIQQMQNHDMPVSLAKANSFNPSAVMNGHNNDVVNDVDLLSLFDSCNAIYTPDDSQLLQTQNSFTSTSLPQAGPNNPSDIINGCSNFMSDRNNVLLEAENGRGLQSPQNRSYNGVELQQARTNSERSGQNSTTYAHNRPPATVATEVPSGSGENATISQNAGLSFTGVNTVQNNNAGQSYPVVNPVPNSNAGQPYLGVNTVPNSNADLSFYEVRRAQTNNASLYIREESLTSSQTDSISFSQNSQISVSTISTELSADLDNSLDYLEQLSV